MLDQELIHPTFGLDSWLTYSRRETAEGFSQFKQKVFEKDKWSCFYCGFKAKHGMRVINLDGNYYNNKMSNMYTVCPLCFWSRFIEHASSAENKRGVLIHMPELKQSEINGIMHAIFCTVSATTVHEKTAESVYKSMKLRAKTVESIYGEGRSDPGMFGKMVINSLNVDQKVHSEILKDLRFLPDMTAFVEDIKAWSKEAAKSM